jgi:hypothetical protein
MKNYTDLTEKQQAELLELEITKQLELSAYLGISFEDFTDVNISYSVLSKIPRNSVPYVLYCNSETFRRAIYERAMFELKNKQYLPVDRNSNVTIIYTDGE